MVSVRKDLWLHNRHQAVLVEYVKVGNSNIIFDHNEFKSSVRRIWPCRHTCWQMLAYLARTLAFSAMPRADGQPSEILRTHLHLAKSQPSFLYWAQRSERPSRPTGKQQATEQFVLVLHDVSET